MNTAYPFRKIYGSPSILAAVTFVGLLFGLFGDGIWDVISWIALAIPLLVLVRKIATSNKSTPPRSAVRNEQLIERTDRS